MFKFIRSLDSKFSFAAGFVASFLLFAVIILAQLANRDQEIARQKSTGLGSTAGVDWNNPYNEWRSGPQLLNAVFPSRSPSPMYQKGGVVLEQSQPRKIVRTGELWLSVNDPIRTITDITAIAQQYSGYTVNQQNQVRAVTGEEGDITVRVAADRFDEARGRVKGLAVRVEQEHVTANDATKESIDFDARLRSLRAQEEQYLQILKSAHKVEDIVDVTEKLNDVRSQIERTQSDSDFLQKTVETSLIQVHLQSAPGGRFAGLDWHPLMRAKLELRDGIEALGEFAGALFAILVRLPAILLWLLTLAALCAVAWRIMRKLWKWFVPTKPVATST
jgi:hypothetical protein